MLAAKPPLAPARGSPIVLVVGQRLSGCAAFPVRRSRPAIPCARPPSGHSPIGAAGGATTGAEGNADICACGCCQTAYAHFFTRCLRAPFELFDATADASGEGQELRARRLSLMLYSMSREATRSCTDDSCSRPLSIAVGSPAASFKLMMPFWGCLHQTMPGRTAVHRNASLN